MPHIYLIGGANGSGKTTTAMRLLPDFLNCHEFVNADVIASGLSAFNPTSVSFSAGRQMISRIEELILKKSDFAFETTLASRSFIPLLKEAKTNGHSIHLLYLWLSDVTLAIERVESRFKSGGHFVAHDIIERRYKRGRDNFVTRYMPIADTWYAFDNSGNLPLLVAEGGTNFITQIFYKDIWEQIIKR